MQSSVYDSWNVFVQVTKAFGQDVKDKFKRVEEADKKEKKGYDQE